jgi:PAS domain S-box-containing protein
MTRLSPHPLELKWKTKYNYPVNERGGSFGLLRHKLLAWFLLISLIPLLGMSLIGFATARNALQRGAFRELEALRSAKADQIETYWLEKQRDLEALSDTVVALGLDAFSRLDATATSQAGPADLLTRLKEEYSYQDLLLVSPEDGYVFYSVAHQPDYHTRLLTGPYRDSNLGRLVAQVLKTREFGLTDFERYAPSQGTPAAFMAQPLLDAQGQVAAILVARISLDEINFMMQERTGLGETGETYLVGPDHLWRSDSRFLASLGVDSAVLNPQTPVDTPASRAALAGQSGTQVIQNYRGARVLSSWTPLRLAEPQAAQPAGIRWALIAEMEQGEVGQPVMRLALTAGALAVGAGLLVVLAAFLESRDLSKPIVEVSEAATALADGDLTRRVQVGTGDEIERLAQAFNRMADKLAGRVGTLERRVEEGTTALTTTATHLQQEIAARMRTDQALREREAQYRALFERVPVGLYRSTPDGTIVDANPAMVHMLGYPDRESLLGVNAVSLYLDAEDRSRWRTLLEQADVLRDFEIQVRRNDGSIIWLRNTARAVKDERGRTIYHEGSLEDVTQRRQVEAEVHSLNVALERQVDDRTRELAALYEVSATASRSQDLGTLLAEALSRATAALQSEAGAIHMRHEGAASPTPAPDAADSAGAASSWRLAAQQGISTDRIAALGALLAAGGLGDWIVEHNEAVLIPDVTADQRTAQTLGQAGRLTLLVTPLQVGGRVLGLLSVPREPGQTFNREEVALLGALADQIGLAVEGDRLRQLAQRASVLAERQRLARDLHDTVTQLLYGLVTLAEAGQAQLEAAAPDAIQHTLARIGDTTRQALKEMRLYIHQLRPTVLAEEGLVGALHQRLAAVEGRSDVQARLLADPSIELPAAVEEALYHIAREALNNALKHAQAASVSVTLSCQDGKVVMEILDDGCGFDPESVGAAGMGLTNMRARAESIGGALTVTSKPGAGTRVKVILSQEIEVKRET